MLLTAKIKTLTDTGAPDYNICGQASSALSFTNMIFKMSISKSGGVTQSLVNTIDLSTVSGLIFATYTYGSYDIRFNSFVIDTVTSTLQTDIQVFYTGTTNVVTWEKFNVFIEVSKTGYQPFLNTFEFYNYDVGNIQAVVGLTDTIGNEDFEIILTNNTNNLDIYNRQTKTGSSLLVLRRPFTNEIHAYNMIGSQGLISYDTINGNIGGGNSCIVIDGEDLIVNQTITLFNSESCSTGKMCLSKVWFYNLTTSYNSVETCDGCTNNLSETTASYSIDASLVSVYKIGGVPFFLYEFMNNKIIIEILNYKSEIIESDEFPETVTYALWIANPSSFLNPVDLVFVPSEIGDNILKFTNYFNYEDTGIYIELYICTTVYDLPTCNWWTIESKEDCREYVFTNCRSIDTIVTVQLLDSNKVFQDISTVTVTGFDTLDLSFATDGIYMIKVLISGSEYKYYSLPIYCLLQTCYLSFLDKVLCNKVSLENCNEVDHYNFNAFLINSHTYFLLLNQEFNYNYIYDTISADKVLELYTLKTFIDRFAEYCEASDSPCIPCSQ